MRQSYATPSRRMWVAAIVSMAAAGFVVVVAGSTAEADRPGDLVAAHNAARAKVKVPPLTWDDDLATYAQRWADHLATSKGCAMEHRPRKGEFAQKHGENLYWAGPVMYSDGTREAQVVSPSKVVGSWEKEDADYDPKTHTCAKGKVCGHYTQVVWSTSKRVGCGVAMCTGGDKAQAQIWVCNYDPPGNYVGQKPF